MLTQSGTLAAAGNVQLNAARGIQSSGHLLAGSDAESTTVHDANLQLDRGRYSRQWQSAR